MFSMDVVLALEIFSHARLEIFTTYYKEEDSP